MQTCLPMSLFFSSGRYSKSPDPSSEPGNKTSKAGISRITGTSDPCFFWIEVAAFRSGSRSGVVRICLLPVLLMRWAIPAAEFLGETAKGTHSARIIPSTTVSYVIVSRRQGTGHQQNEWRGAKEGISPELANKKMTGSTPTIWGSGSWNRLRMRRPAR